MRITKAKLTSGQEIEFGDINIFVGPNGTGKTTLLREIFKKSVDQTTKSLWVDSVEIDEISKADAAIIKSFLKNDGGEWSTTIHRDADGRIANAGDSRCTEQSRDGLLSVERGNASPEQKNQVNNDFSFRRNLISFEATDERLSVQSQTKIFSPLRATDLYNWIDNRQSLKDEIDSKFYSLFGQHFSILSHLREVMHLGVSKELCTCNSDNAEEMERWRTSNHTPIKESGDGMRATIRLFFSLYDPILKIIFIDEPEVFIYPAQRKKIAEEIKRLSAEQGKQTFLVTHDSTTLSGLVDRINETETIKVFYLKNRGTIVDAPFTRGGPSVTPATKQAKYLEALFHQTTIFVEGNNDRFLYEETMSSLYPNKLSMQDALFVDTAGADRAIETARLVNDTKVNAAFIFDGDVLTKSGKLENVIKVYSALGGSVELDTKSPGEKIEALKAVGIFIAPVPDLKDWVTEDDEFPYSTAEALKGDPSQKGFDEFTEGITRYLGSLIV